MQRKMVELLAPAGNYDAFLAAVENGADAVYLGGRLHNARQFAGNFEDSELERALDYAHARGVSIFLTLNTLLLDSEMDETVAFAGKAYEMGIDAVIVQDLGFAAQLRKALPGLPLHASTQMTIYNMDGVKTIESLGMTRAVLARELSLAEIEKICKNTTLEIETFVHGALCISYSGQCLMSSIIGGRSGNRGKCAQPCRLPYTIQRDSTGIKEGYLMSPKDICYIENLSQLIDAGVYSFKIEGRMKSPEYVATVVSKYRKYIDLALGREDTKVSAEDMHRLLQSFNRGGFSKGYLLGKTGPDMMSYQKPKNWGTYLGTVVSQDRNTGALKIKLENELGMGDGIEAWTKNIYKESPGGIITKIVRNGQLVKRAAAGDIVTVSVVKGRVDSGSKVYKTSDKEMNEEAGRSFASGNRKLEVSCNFTMQQGQYPVLTLSDNDGNTASITGSVFPEAANNKPLTKERISEQLSKMGSTPFNIKQITLDVGDGLVIPISELNSMRRAAAEMLEKQRIQSFKRENAKILIPFPGNRQNNAHTVKISGMFYKIPQDIELDTLRLDRIYIPFVSLVSKKGMEAVSLARESGTAVFAYIPPIIKGKYSELIENNIIEVSRNIDGFLMGNLSAVQALEKLDPVIKDKVVGDYSLNITNSSSLYKLKEMGFNGIMLSYEMNEEQIRSLVTPEGMDIELGVYGRVPIMNSEYCPIGSAAGNKAPGMCPGLCKKGSYSLKDRLGASFPLICDNIDCRCTIFNSNVLFAPDIVKKAGSLGVDYIRLSFIDESPKEIYDIVNLHRELLKNAQYRSTEIIDRIKAKGFTKGHFSRGV